jgi:BirA family transcriptional regulator, biotin operon repressor / biotin---[acetyl-CoA-carboxylase] ligase
MIEIISQTGSTSADLAARLRGGEYLPEGSWLVADRQSAGRGRLGREWLDGAGNFMGSTVVHLHGGDPAPESLALLAGLALYEVIAPLIVAPQSLVLKWPNDVLLGRAKLAGILLERQGEAVIVGIGVNLVSAPVLPDRETVALAAIAQAPDRDTFAAALARQFALELERWRSFGVSPIVNRWLRAGTPVGTRLTAEGQDGTFAGLTPEGSLQLRLADGSLRTIHAGEVNLTD